MNIIPKQKKKLKFISPDKLASCLTFSAAVVTGATTGAVVKVKPPKVGLAEVEVEGVKLDSEKMEAPSGAPAVAADTPEVIGVEVALGWPGSLGLPAIPVEQKN